MIASMTGFARRETSGLWGTLVCELRSVNHRFLEVGFRLPEELRSAGRGAAHAAHPAAAPRQGRLHAQLSAPAGRGRRPADRRRGARSACWWRCRWSAVPCKEPASVNALDVLRWPGVLREESGGGDELQRAAQALVGQTLEELVATRAREGVRLRELLGERCASLEILVAGVRARLPEVQARMRARLHERLAEISASPDLERLEQELAILLQRLDVDEELERLSGHIEEVRRVIAASEPAGRRLDFLMQELNREANTLSSKSQDLETTRSAVDMKVLIEQMREQVQNAE